MTHIDAVAAAFNRTKVIAARRSGNKEPAEVRIMAVAEGHAMVRRPGCIPFVVTLKELAHKRPDPEA